MKVLRVVTIVAYGMLKTVKVSNCPYDLVVKGRGQIYINWLIANNGGSSYI